MFQPRRFSVMKLTSDEFSCSNFEVWLNEKAVVQICTGNMQNALSVLLKIVAKRLVKIPIIRFLFSKFTDLLILATLLKINSMLDTASASPVL